MNTSTDLIRKNICLGLLHGVIACAALALSPGARASLLVDTHAYCLGSTSGACPTYQVVQTYNNDTYPGTGTPTASVANGYEGVQSTASAQANYGALKVLGHASTDGGVSSSQSDNGSAKAKAGWYDDITINSPGIASGTAAVLTARVAVGGGFSRAGSFGVNPGASDTYGAHTDGTWNLAIFNEYRSGSFGADLYRTGYDDVRDPGTFFGVYTITAPIQLGWQFGIRMEMEGYAAAGSKGLGANASATFDLGHSAYWGGITSIMVNGEAIPFTLTSQSGHDWTQSSIPTTVPIPAAAWLLGSGLLGLIGVARRKRVA